MARRSLETHDHSNPASGGRDINPRSIGKERPVESLDVDNLNSERSGRIGDTVVFNPSDTGPYIDLSDAVVDVPETGTLLLNGGQIDVATQGRISVSKSINICTPTDNEITLWNAEATPIDQPVIELDSAPRSVVRGVNVHHSGASPAILINNSTRTFLDRVRLNGKGSAPKGVRYTGDSWFTRTFGLHISDFTEHGLLTESDGSDGFHWANHINVGQPGGATAFEDRNFGGSHLFGGQYDSDSTTGVAIHFNADAGSPSGGSSAFGTLTENAETAFKFGGGGNSVVNHTVKHAIVRLNFVSKLAHFVKSQANIIEDPVTIGSGGDVAVWESGSEQDTIRSTYHRLDGLTWTNNGADQPSVSIKNAISNYWLGLIHQEPDVRVTVPHSLESNAPVWFDGNDWYEASGTTFVP